MKAKDRQIQELKRVAENLKRKLAEAAQTIDILISTIKFVAEHFAGKITDRILTAAAKHGDRWLGSNGFPEQGNRTTGLPRSIANDLELELKYLPGKRILCTYDGTVITKVDGLIAAKEQFPKCTIIKKENEMLRY